MLSSKMESGSLKVPLPGHDPTDAPRFCLCEFSFWFGFCTPHASSIWGLAAATLCLLTSVVGVLAACYAALNALTVHAIHLGGPGPRLVQGSGAVGVLP